MKTVFLYDGPHASHNIWAKSIHSQFIYDRVSEFSIPNISRLITSFKTFRKVPKNIDLILCESSSQLITGLLCKLFGKTKKLISIVSEPKMYYLKNANWLKRKFYIWALNQCSLLVATSPMMASYIPKEVTCRKEIVFPAYMPGLKAVTIKEKLIVGKSGVKQKSRPSRKKLKVNLKNKNLIYVNKISKEKGTDLLIAAFKEIKKDFPKSNLHIIGRSSQAFGKEDFRTILEKESPQGVYFEGWVKDPNEYRKKCSICISLARFDPANISVLEGMRFGLVPVVSEGIGNRYVVKKINKELVVKNPEQAAKIVKKLWKNPALLRKYSKKASKISKEYGDGEKSKNLFLEAVAKIK